MQEKNNLNWHTYSDHLRDMLHEMMKSDELTDLTLVCDDKKLFRAHKVVLSACSPVFKTIIKDLPSHNPTIYLRGIQHQEMESILEFMYLGVANFYQERMNEFLNVGMNLEVKELSKDVKFDYPNINIVEDQQEVKLDRKCSIPEEDVNFDNNTTVIKDSAKNKNTNGKFFCENCDYETPYNSYMKKHISVHEGAKYACDQCDYKATQTSSLRRHIQSKHEGIKYGCDQ